MGEKNYLKTRFAFLTQKTEKKKVVITPPLIEDELEVTENGIYEAPVGKGYVKVTVETSGGGSVVKESWNQDTEAVRNYIAEVDYTNVPYTDSDIEDYAPTPPVPSVNTKPIGKTIDNVTYYNNIPNEETPFASTNSAGTVEPLDQVRWINSITNNMRDLGGWSCDGGTVKYGLLYRCADINSQDENLFINELGINTEIDLTADGVPAFSGKMRFVSARASVMYTLIGTDIWRTNIRGVFDAVIYRDPTVFHCTYGADRTGTLACILEGILGVSQSDIDKDYELTSFYIERARNQNYQHGDYDWAHLIAQIEALSGSTFRDKCVNFVLSLGFTAREINAFRKVMIDGTPEDITAPTYTITNSLTGCSTNNDAVSISMNEPYQATITASEGYSLDGASVSIIMGNSVRSEERL